MFQITHKKKQAIIIYLLFSYFIDAITLESGRFL